MYLNKRFQIEHVETGICIYPAILICKERHGFNREISIKIGFLKWIISIRVYCFKCKRRAL